MCTNHRIILIGVAMAFNFAFSSQHTNRRNLRWPFTPNFECACLGSDWTSNLKFRSLQYKLVINLRLRKQILCSCLHLCQISNKNIFKISDWTLFCIIELKPIGTCFSPGTNQLLITNIILSRDLSPPKTGNTYILKPGYENSHLQDKL